jgi:hypothetical protein
VFRCARYHFHAQCHVPASEYNVRSYQAVTSSCRSCLALTPFLLWHGVLHWQRALSIATHSPEVAAAVSRLLRSIITLCRTIAGESTAPSEVSSAAGDQTTTPTGGVVDGRTTVKSPKAKMMKQLSIDQLVQYAQLVYDVHVTIHGPSSALKRFVQ